MFFTSSEQKNRTQQFDTFQYNTDLALRQPQILATLGTLATELREVNRSCFLPNMSSGRFTVPPNQKKLAKPAFIPISNEEADRVFDLINPLLQDYPLSWPAWTVGMNNPYGCNPPLNEVMHDFTQPVLGEANNTIYPGLRPSSVALTQAQISMSRDGRTFFSTRPVIMARDTLLRDDTWSQAATVAHEQVHALDIINDGILYSRTDFGTATEARGYHVSAVMYGNNPCYNEASKTAYWAESVRHMQITDPSRPFMPSRWLIDQFMQAQLV